ncbi:MAG: PHP domain-containing protein [Clostridia bacterium]|nr:PHP domain-containing protein [Clostridia bacterium]
MLLSDLHTHTTFSHGKGSPQDNVLAALRLGLKQVAICEHASAHAFYGVRGARLAQLKAEVDALKLKYAGQIDVLFGLECNLTGFGKSDVPADPEFCDVLALGFHKGSVAANWSGVRLALQVMGIGRNPTYNADAIAACARKTRLTFISHPSLYIPMDIAVLAEMSAELGVHLEINGSRVTLTERELRLAKSMGATFIINSDAHSPQRVGDVERAVRAAREADVLDRVVNYSA